LTGQRKSFLLTLMRILIVPVALVLLSGCFWRKTAGSQRDGTATGGSSKLTVTPETGLVGKVAFVNTQSRFVVLNFPIGHLPAVDQHLSVYREGLAVGEVKVTGPQYDDNIVADLVKGDSRVGDQVRDR
jgi:hypothetical protein